MEKTELIKRCENILDEEEIEDVGSVAELLRMLLAEYKKVTRTAANPLTVDYRSMVEKILIPNGYKTVHIGNPLEVSASQFLYKSQVEHLISELNLYTKPNSTLTVESVVEAVMRDRFTKPVSDDFVFACSASELRTALEKIMKP